MPPDHRKIIYWDSGVWLSYINGETERLSAIDPILKESASDKGNCKLYTSVLSQVEVAFARSEQEKQALNSEIEEMIDQLWADTDCLTVVEFHEGIGKIARNLIRDCVSRGWSLQAMDALHLATAAYIKADAIHTYDEKWLKLASILDIPIMRPPDPDQLSLLSELERP